jgi:hypothetical protein
LWNLLGGTAFRPFGCSETKFLPIFALGVFILGVMGLINGFTGKGKALPIIGKYQLIK